MKAYTAKEIFQMMENTNPLDLEESSIILEIFTNASKDIKIDVIKLLAKAIEKNWGDINNIFNPNKN